MSGITLGYLDYIKINLLKGRDFTQADQDKCKKVCIISNTMANYYFENENPIGQLITINMDSGASDTLAVVGVYEYSEAVFGKQDTTVPEKDRYTQLYIPEQTALTMNQTEEGSANGYDYITILLKNTADVQMATDDIKSFFEEKYENNEDWQIETYNMASDMSVINTVINVITIAIAFIAAISLIVGGVGVMNIMLVSITERTKEIGIRKALGAQNKDISQQFLIESVVLCLIGGIIGILAGLGLGALIGKIAGLVIQNYYAEYQNYIIMSIRPSAVAIILSVGFSMLIGIFFGHYPAKKAAQMEVIDALRYE
jgi:putative ABC transport system permease protein